MILSSFSPHFRCLNELFPLLNVLSCSPQLFLLKVKERSLVLSFLPPNPSGSISSNFTSHPLPLPQTWPIKKPSFYSPPPSLPCLSNLPSSCQRSQHSSFITSSHHSSFLSLTLTPHVKGQLCVAPAYWSPHLEMILINKAGSPFEVSPPARLEKTHIDSLGLVPLLMSHFKLSDLRGCN